MMKEQSKAFKGSSIAFFLAVIFCTLLLWFTIYRIMQHTNGMFSYVVDDAYIHMQIAKNLAFHGTWGINAGEFSSASSSLLYTVLLAGSFRLFGDSLYLPFLINAVAGLLLLFITWRWLVKHGVKPFSQLIILILLILFTPLPLLIMTGMEHTLQCLFSFLFLFSFADWIQKNKETGLSTLKIPLPVLIYAVLTATIRYEGLFLVGMACLALLYWRKIPTAFLLGIIAVIPLIIFGIYSVSKGSYFLPNSVLVKSEAAQFSAGGLLHAFGNILAERLAFSKSGVALLTVQRLLLILPLTFLVFLKYSSVNRSFRFLLLALTGASFLQVTLADTGKFYRYEGYLVFCSLAVISLLVYRYGKDFFSVQTLLVKALVLVISFFLFLPLVLRAITANAKLSRAGINIYEQQYQMSRFLSSQYNNSIVAANDIGAIAYFTNSGIVDLWGLGDVDIARSKKGGYWTSQFLDSVSRKKGASIAIVYDSWIDQSLPKEWKKAGEWKISNNVVCGDDHVSFYAIDSAGLTTLKNRLQLFQPSLPATVSVTYE